MLSTDGHKTESESSENLHLGYHQHRTDGAVLGTGAMEIRNRNSVLLSGGKSHRKDRVDLDLSFGRY